MKKHIASILFLFLLSTFQLIAQSHSVKRLGIEQGLSNNYVVSITKINKGSYGLPQKKDLISLTVPALLLTIKMI